MITVELKGARFFGYHGLYVEERKTGNEFEVSLSVRYNSTDQPVNAIDDTVNYVRLYEIVKSFMSQPEDLLETLAMSIASRIKEEFPSVCHINVAISKLHPPIPQFTGSVAVCFQQDY